MATTIKTPLDLRTAFETISKNQHDVDDTYQMLTDARNKIEEEMNLLIMEKLDQSQMANAGDTYLTMKPLPADWGKTKKIVVDIIPYYPIPFKQRIGWRFSARRYYIDVLNQKFALTGAVTGPKVINHWYQPICPPLTTDNETEDIAENGLILWPQRFWRVVAFEALALYQGNYSGDDVSRTMSPAQWNQYQRLRDSLMAWDHDIKLQGLNDQTGYAEQDDRPFDVGLL